MSLKEGILEKVRLQEERNTAILAAIPEKYRHYVLEMERSSRISNKEIDLDKDLTSAGCYSSDGKTFLTLKSVYFTVMGKLALFNDWCAENGYSFKISEAVFAQVGTVHSCRKTISVYNAQGKLIKDASGTASVGFGGTGVNSTNPLENAETSALGRALTFLGMGTQVEQVASAEEIQEAEARSSAEPENRNLQKERFIVSEIKSFIRNNQSITNLAATNQDTGDIVAIWLQGEMAGKAQALPNGAVVDAVLAQIPGKEGMVNTFVEFELAS